MNYPEFEEKIKNLIAKDELEVAIEALSKYFNENPNLNEIIIQSGMYHSLKKDQRLGIVGNVEVQQNMNQLRLNILEFLQAERKNQADAEEQEKQNNNKDFDSIFKMSLARWSVLCILKKEKTENGLTVKEIDEGAKMGNRKWIVLSIYEMEEFGLVEKSKIGKLTHWKLTDEGGKLAEKMKDSLLLENQF